ncbi:MULTISPECIES: hypothetical protein [Legionella]|uniref:Uncharacterized protein n=2 Tax=Legionella TaxID=445 RepID=A0A0W1AME6_9GAMM|nr:MULTISPECIES: hypothetical protein [Legionella]HCW6793428.1 hypothetical protein [Legionella pneumophila]KTD35523.1 hypothetical protein Lmor_0970 [Legionella moravica]KTD82533.1 hypothetical protein Lwal_0571 [Legionella waltersii]SNU95265.1 Uncharacterised protein [Legionella waltersii]STX62111.1 Uncharacterised protein [Legionella moravica]
MNTKDCFVTTEYTEKTSKTVPLLDEKERHELSDLEHEKDLDEEFYAIRSMN